MGVSFKLTVDDQRRRRRRVAGGRAVITPLTVTDHNLGTI